MDKDMWLQYPSSIEQIVEQNESFDSCIIRICYPGRNKNRTAISRQAIESAIPSMYNCPIVCNYNVIENTIGGHDIEVLETNNGMRLINLTDAVGVIPASSNYYWETIIDNGIEHEYLCVEAILWKRSAAYAKIKRDGVTSQSMEITVKNGRSVDGFYEIDEFVFTAFCLLGDDVEPCFESASLEVFSLQQYKRTFEAMMTDLKEHYSTAIPLNNVGESQKNLLKGGNILLEKLELLSKYGLAVEDLDFSIDDFTVDELKSKFEALKENNSKNDFGDEADGKLSIHSDNNIDNGTDESKVDESTSNALIEQADEADEQTDSNPNNKFSLTGEQFVSQLCESLSLDKYTDPFLGEISRYLYVDYDSERSEVYCYDVSENWKLYGFSYFMNGDNVVVNFNSKKRKKFSIVDFNEGVPEPNYKYAFETYGKAISASKDAEMSCIQNESNQKCSQYIQTVANLQSELNTLKEYQKSKLDEERKNAENAIFAYFAELDGNEAFEALRSDCAEMTLEDIENKCYEIKGRIASMKFSINKSKPTRLIVEKKYEDEPYGGLFIQYPPTNI